MKASRHGSPVNGSSIAEEPELPAQVPTSHIVTTVRPLWCHFLSDFQLRFASRIVVFSLSRLRMLALCFSEFPSLTEARLITIFVIHQDHFRDLHAGETSPEREGIFW